MPHVCGDEPLSWFLGIGHAYVCPTYVGMNQPCFPLFLCAGQYAPRMWG